MSGGDEEMRHAAQREGESAAPSDHLGSVAVEDGMAVIRLPLSKVHALRVALAPCPCRAPKSTATSDIRRRLARSLGTLDSRGRR